MIKNNTKRKSISPQELNKFFEGLAVSLNAYEKAICKEYAEKRYKDDLNSIREELACYTESLKNWKINIRAGGLLRILEHLKAFDGKRIDKKRLETALLTFNFILSCSCDLNGLLFYFNKYSTEISLDDVRRTLRFIRKI
jgi:hypothetical protein